MSKKHQKHLQNLDAKKVQVKYCWYDDLAKYLLYALVFSLIFIHSIQFFAVFASPKLFCLRLISILILLIFGYKILKEKEVNLISPQFYVLLCSYGFVSILNTIFSVNYHTSLFGIPDRYLGLFTTLNFIFISFSASQIFNKKRDIISFLKYFVFLGFIASLYGLAQFYKIIGDPALWDQDPTQRVFGTFGHANHFAAFLGMNAMLSFGFMIYSKDIKSKLFYFSVSFLSFLTIIDTASRGGLLAFLIALMFLIISVFSIKKISKLTFIAISLILVLSFLLSPILVSKFKESVLFQRMTVLEQNYKNGFVPDRISWWFSMIEMIKDKPILGHGISTFKDVYSQYRRLDYRNPDDLQYEIEPEAGHMEYLNIAATQGILGLITYLLPIIYVFYHAKRYLASKTVEKEDFLLIGLLASLIVYLTQVLLSFGVVDSWTLFFILLGVASCFINCENPDKIRNFKLSKISNIIFAISIIISINYFLFNINQIKVDFFRRNANTAAIIKNYPYAIKSYEKIIALENNAFYITDYADFLVKLALSPDMKTHKEEYLKKSIDLYEKALQFNNLHPHIYSNLGLASIRLAEFYQNDTSLSSQYINKSIENYEIAVNKGPNNPLHLYNLMKIYALISQFDKFYASGDKILAIRTDYKDTLNLLIEISKHNGNKEMQEKYESILNNAK